MVQNTHICTNVFAVFRIFLCEIALKNTQFSWTKVIFFFLATRYKYVGHDYFRFSVCVNNFWGPFEIVPLYIFLFDKITVTKINSDFLLSFAFHYCFL